MAKGYRYRSDYDWRYSVFHLVVLGMEVSATDSRANRIEWIDTAKGICILLVLLHHCSGIVHASYPCSRVLVTFRMPLYFILSGLFFKQYGPKVFLVKKINKLLVPYVFFYVVTGVLLPVIVYRLCGHSMLHYSKYGFEAIFSIFSERIIVNPSIWFLFCLFELNVLFYLLFMISKNCKHSIVVLGILSLAMGIVGLFLSYKKIDLPYFLDSSLTVLPFFYFGYFLRNHTSILYKENTKRTKLFSYIFFVVSMVIIRCFNYGWLSVIGNTYGDIKGLIQVYPYGIMGTCAVLLLSKAIGRVPVLSYIGRYSIIVLCTHVFAMRSMALCFRDTIENKSMCLLVVYLTTILLCLALIPVVKKYLGVFTAQKDLIRLDKKNSI